MVKNEHYEPTFLSFFFRNVAGVFLHFIQCIKTLLLSYQNQHFDNFCDFSPQGVVNSYSDWKNGRKKFPPKKHEKLDQTEQENVW